MAQENLTGKEILNYRFENFIGGGGMGSVYRAANKNIDEKVAIKVLNANLVESDIVRRKFLQEAKTLLTLHHTNIVAYQNFYEDENGNVFLVMEYVDGITLDTFINQKQGPIPEKMAYPMFLQILDACAYAHKHGIVHRDIKPANIILTNDNDGNFLVKILDFGIAKIISESETENDSEKGMIIGTPAYMSPEQVRGEDLDKRSDIYSLGVLLHQMLTGRTPYDTTTLSEIEIQRKVVGETLPRMKEFYPAVSDKMQRIVDKAAQKEPAKRYQSCGDFRTALKNVFEPEKLPKMIKYAAAVFVLLALGGGWRIWDYNRVKVSYFKDYAEQWGVPTGIGKADYKNREASYRFVKQRGKVIRVSHINSKGKIDRHHDSEHMERYEDMKLNYRENGKIDNVEVYDRNGKLLYIKGYEKDITTVIFKQDHKGSEIFLASSTTKLFQNAFDNSRDQKSRITRWLLTYDENGFVKKIKYATFGNELVGDAEGLYGREYIADQKGRVVEEHYLGFNDSIKANSAGLAIKKFEYDNNDDWTKVTYFSANGELSSDGNGCQIVIIDYDSYGNRIKESYYNEQGSLTLRTDCKVAGFAYTIEKGNRIRQAAFDIDGQPCYNGDFGCSIIENEYDENGYQTVETYRDLDENAVMIFYGFATVKNTNDLRGNVLMKQYLDADGNVCENTSNYAKEIFEYDSLGNQISEFYYGTNDSLCSIGDGYAGTRLIYNDKNKVTVCSYYGADNQPCAVNGIYTVKNEYDKRGNETKRSFYAKDGKTPTLNDFGIAGWKYEYDDNGNMTTMWYFDTKGKHTSGSLGYAGCILAYDKNGYLEETKNLDKNGNLAYLANDGYARIKYINDQRGNHIEISKYNADNHLIGTVERRVFNNYDDIIEITYFDSNGNKVLHNGYHKYVNIFNERHQIIEARAYDTNGQLKNGAAIAKVKYDKRGNETEYAFFDANEKLIIRDNYAFVRKEYDAMNRLIRETYFDENSKPANTATQFPEIIYGYDKWGNNNYEAYADGNGKLIDYPQKGWTIKRSVFDIKGNELEIAFFDKNDKPCIDKENEAHRMTYVYNKQNKIAEIRYYDIDGLRKKSYAIERREYNEQGQIIEARAFNHLDKAMNYGSFHKVIYVYDEQGHQAAYRKEYDVNNKLVRTLKYNKQTQAWEQVDAPSANPAPASASESGAWRAVFRELSAKCPYKTNNGDTEMTSITLTSNACVITKSYLEISKYNVSDSDLEQKKNEETAWAQNIKQKAKMSSDVTLTVVALDKAKRELFRIKC